MSGQKSRIGNFKRSWEDDDTPVDAADWPPSQEPPKKKQAIAAPSKTGTSESAKARRLRMIQEALAEESSTLNTADVSQSSAASSSTAVSSSTVSSRSSSHSDSGGKKASRELPWNENLDTLKAKKLANKPPSKADTKAASGKERLAGIFLSPEQKYVLDQAKNGKNIFFTGSAGTGKSVLLREIISALRLKFSRNAEAVAITASTGIAACNIGGVTLHSFSGAGICAEPAEQLVARIRRGQKANKRWVRTDVLIIDEISMVDGALFDKLENIARLIRRNNKPFGGIQIISCGDFFQLPPVVKGGAPTNFAFEAQSWKDCIDVTFNLTQVFRQKDQDFVDMLNRMRLGALLKEDIRRFKGLSRQPYHDTDVEPTELFPRREDVDRANRTRMAQLSGKEMCYKAIDGGSTDPAHREKLLTNFMAPAELKVRLDSQVMLIKNMDETLVNGSVGKVVGFCDPSCFVGVNPETGEIIRNDATIDVNTKEGKKAWERKQKLIDEGKIEDAPVVKFQPVRSQNPRYECFAREPFKVELPGGEVQASRAQYPYILSWAMSIHKSQGQTLDHVKVDLGRIFEKGQAYVALSRATSLEGLQVLNFDASKVQAHPKVVDWYKTLSTYSGLKSSD